MIRCLIFVALALVQPANAECRSCYHAAFDAGQNEAFEEMLAFRERYGLGLFDLSSLDVDGTVTHLGSGFTFPVELVAIYDLGAEQCHWAFDVDIAPDVPRTAALAVRALAKAAEWPADIMAPPSTRQGWCISLSVIATAVGDLDYIAFQVVDDVAYVFGAKWTKATS